MVEAAAFSARPGSFDFETVLLANYDRIARTIVRVIGDPSRAEELAVEAFWRLWKHPDARNTSDRIFIVAAAEMSEAQAVAWPTRYTECPA